jgi:3-hydroxybutyryl-CoA dehydratase
MKTVSHERFSSTIVLTPATVSAFARAAGDDNPLHHDPDHAAGTRYGRLVASGPQTTAHLMALTASHFSRRGVMVGLEFWFRFRRPVFANETIRLEWLVVSVKHNSRLGGDVIELRGRIRNEMGETAVGAKGRVLVSEKL